MRLFSIITVLLLLSSICIYKPTAVLADNTDTSFQHQAELDRLERAYGICSRYIERDDSFSPLGYEPDFRPLCELARERYMELQEMKFQYLMRQWEIKQQKWRKEDLEKIRELLQ